MKEFSQKLSFWHNYSDIMVILDALDSLWVDSHVGLFWMEDESSV